MKSAPAGLYSAIIPLFCISMAGTVKSLFFRSAQSRAGQKGKVPVHQPDQPVMPVACLKNRLIHAERIEKFVGGPKERAAGNAPDGQ